MFLIKRMSNSSGYLKKYLIDPLAEETGIGLRPTWTWDKKTLVYELTKNRHSFWGLISREGTNGKLSIAYCSYYPNNRIEPNGVISVEEAIIKSEIGSAKLTLENLENLKVKGIMKIYGKSSQESLVYDFTELDHDPIVNFLEKSFQTA